MLEMLMQWYRRRFSDPEAIALLVILVAGFGILFFFSGLLALLSEALQTTFDKVLRRAEVVIRITPI